MAEHIEIDPRGLDALAQKMSGRLTPAIKAASMEIAIRFQAIMAPYPPASEANEEKVKGAWYERGYGTRYSSGSGRKTSETLGRKWSVEPYGETGARIINTASYSPYVHMKETQAWFHELRGWKTNENARQEVIESGIAQDIMDKNVKRPLE